MQVEQRLEAIEARNKKVEMEKAWETSLTRVFVICFITYILVSITMLITHIDRPLINALIPTLGFFLSVQSLPLIKNIWIKNKGK
jgi:hypothetical protein